MASKRRRPAAKPKRSPPVQFRIADEVENGLTELAERLGLSSANAVAKDLATLALYKMDVRHLDLMLAATDVFGHEAFDRICVLVATTVDAENSSRKTAGNPPLSEDDRQQLIRATLTDLSQRLRAGMLVSPQSITRAAVLDSKAANQVEAKVTLQRQVPRD